MLIIKGGKPRELVKDGARPLFRFDGNGESRIEKWYLTPAQLEKLEKRYKVLDMEEPSKKEAPKKEPSKKEAPKDETVKEDLPKEIPTKRKDICILVEKLINDGKMTPVRIQTTSTEELTTKIKEALKCQE